MPTTLRPNKIQVPKTDTAVGTGWLPPVIDRRDYTELHPQIVAMAQKLSLPKKGKEKFGTPATVDLRTWCAPIENQGGLGSCTANAAVGIIEYGEKKAFHKYIDGSRVVVDKNPR